MPTVRHRLSRSRPDVWATWTLLTVSNRIEDFRRVATRYDRLARNDASAVALAVVIAFWR